MANPTSYQRVTTATDYDATAGRAYLKFDGVDDALATGSIDFTATDKMTVFAGVRKLSDARGMLLRLTPDTASFRIEASSVTSATYQFRSAGTTQAISTTVGVYAAPITSVLTGIGSISTDVAILRVNGTQAAVDVNDQGTGSYSNSPLTIGIDPSGVVPFNGHLYSLIVRGAQSTDAQIVSAETYVNSKTGAY